jgi:hypothetical protein
MTFNGSDRKQVRAKEKEAKLDESNRLAYTRRIMSDGPGRKWMHDLLVRCHIFQTAFAAGQPDNTAFRLGEQNTGLQIFADVIAASPQEYVLMMNEASIKDAVNDRRYSDDRSTAREHTGGSDSGRDVEGPVTEYDPYAEGGTEG